jgi:hypothetical protein
VQERGKVEFPERVVEALSQRCFASACTPHKLYIIFTRRRRRRKNARVTCSRYAYFGSRH